MKFALPLVFLALFLFEGCVNAKDLYDFNYGNDENMKDSMMDSYGDPFQRPF